MLAQNFKTPADLGIDEKEFGGLVKTLGLLERDEIRYFPATTANAPSRDTPTGFNMLFVRTGTECGTAACMLGWARELTCDPTLFSRLLSPALFDLFCTGVGVRWFCGKNPEDVQPAEGAAALRNFLTFGEARWPQVFASE